MVFVNRICTSCEYLSSDHVRMPLLTHNKKTVLHQAPARSEREAEEKRERLRSQTISCLTTWIARYYSRPLYWTSVSHVVGIVGEDQEEKD